MSGMQVKISSASLTWRSKAQQIPSDAHFSSITKILFYLR